VKIMQIPTIRTARLVLRAFRETDAEPFHEILCGADVLKYFPRHDPPPLERVRTLVASYGKHWEERGYGLWAVDSLATGELMGRCGLQDIPETGEVEVDGLLARESWGQGYATEAAREALRFGFEVVRVPAVVGIVHPGNEASKRILEKLGLRETRRTRYFGMDVIRYEIARPVTP